MTILEVIREAGTEHEIYFLLTSYVEAVRYCDKFHTLPHPMRDLPFAGIEDVRRRVERLRAGIDRTDVLDRPVIGEAAEIFAIALDRLGFLEGTGLREIEEAA
jgi:hypothetical protein